MSDPIENLAKTFLAFPGIGRRQAKRFVYHLLEVSPGEIDKLLTDLKNLRAKVTRCGRCYRFFLNTNGDTQCDICRNKARDNSQLLVVEKDADLDNIERAGTYRGYYFVLGSLATSLMSEPEEHLRLKELVARLKQEPNIKEVILALAANQDGDTLAGSVEQALLPLGSQIKTTLLGRGLSTGAELEYVDPETLKNALKNRS